MPSNFCHKMQSLFTYEKYNQPSKLKLHNQYHSKVVEGAQTAVQFVWQNLQGPPGQVFGPSSLACQTCLGATGSRAFWDKCRACCSSTDDDTQCTMEPNTHDVEVSKQFIRCVHQFVLLIFSTNFSQVDYIQFGPITNGIQEFSGIWKLRELLRLQNDFDPIV